MDNLCEILNTCRNITKRNIISPFVLRAKLFMQYIWQLGLDFDDKVPTECKQLWFEWWGEIETLKKFQISREYFPGESNTDKQLHLFCNASIKAFGVVA